jgi:amino acid transporter
VILAVVQVGSLFSADAWNNITFTAGEVKNPKRNIPLSLVLGTGFVLTVYFLASLGYILVLPLHGDPTGRRCWRGACNMRRKIAWARRRSSRFFTPAARG